MGVLKRVFALTSYGALGAVGTAFWITRKDEMLPLSQSDYLYSTTFYSRLNPHQNPTMNDVCIRRVKTSDIKPEYLEPEGRLTERFCAGVWGTPGFAIQRWYLERKYRNQVPDHLWDQRNLQKATYDVGTLITDHFEVINKTSESIVVRCGDSPRVQQPRASDGVFEMVALPDPEKGEVEFQLKSVFFNSDGPQTNEPVPKHIELAHRWYTKILMESAVRSLLR